MSTIEAVGQPDERSAEGHAGEDGQSGLRTSTPRTARAERAQWSPRDLAIAIGVPTLVLAVHTASYGQYVEDDAGITFAYARSLATGQGPVLQPGAEPVEGFSNPLWLAVLVVARWVGMFDRGAWFGVPDLVLFPKLAALTCAAVMFAVLFGLARLVSSRPVALTATVGTITALVPSFAIWTSSGLENGLFALLVVALAVSLARAAVEGNLLDRRVAVTVGALAGLTALTRPDGLVFIAAYPLVIGLLHTRPLTRVLRSSAWSVGAALLPVGLYLVWRLATFGDWLPNTARAKRQGLPDLADLARPGELIFYAGWLTVLLAVGAVVVALGDRSRTRTTIGVMLVPLALALVAFAVLPRDWMAQYRFATPVWPLAAFVSVLAVAATWRRGARRTRLVAGSAAALALLLTGTTWLDAAAEFRRDPTAPMCFVATSVGQRVNEYADILRVRDGTILAVDGGGTALTTRLRFVDLSGLADARIASLWQERDMVGLRDHVFETVKPTFFKIDSGWAEAEETGLLTDGRLARDYVALITPNSGTGTWVRRDVIADPELLAAARRHATGALTRIDVPFLRGDRTAWICGPTLRPTSTS